MNDEIQHIASNENQRVEPALPKPIPLALGLITSVLILIGVFFPQTYLPRARDTERIQVASVSSAFTEPSLTARAAIVYDVQLKEILFEKNAHAQLPLASITKLMPTLIALESLPRDVPITIAENMLWAEGDSGFVIGERWDLLDLIDATLVTSSNDGATALASAVSGGSMEQAISLMNKRARALDLHQTYFLNPTGLDESGTMAGAYGSAYDVAQLLAFLITQYPEALERTAHDTTLFTPENGASVNAHNTNEALGEIPGFIAGKTGYTDLAGGNFAVAFDVEVGHPIIVVVLGSTQAGRFEDVRTLVRATRDAFK